jgi:hypothetical protein
MLVGLEKRKRAKLPKRHACSAQSCFHSPNKNK